MACCEGSNHNPSPHPSPGPSAIPSPSPSPSLEPSPSQVCCEGCQLWAHASCDHLSPKQLRLLDHAPYYCPACRGELPGHGIGEDDQPPYGIRGDKQPADRLSGLHQAVTQPVPAPAPPPATPPEEETAPLPPPPPPPPQPQPQQPQPPPQPPPQHAAAAAAASAAGAIPSRVGRSLPPSAADIPTVDISAVDIPTVPSTIIWAGEMARDGSEIARDGGRSLRSRSPSPPRDGAGDLTETAACAPPSRSTSVALAGPSSRGSTAGEGPHHGGVAMGLTTTTTTIQP